MKRTLSPSKDQLWFLPLGGTGEIGMNCNLYGHNSQWLMVDCGVTFNAPLTDTSQTLHDVVAADLSFISERNEQLVGLFVTHAHEDHVGAIHHVWKKLKCPVYATKFTAEILRRKLAETGLAGVVPITVVSPNERFLIGPFELECLPITHSVPEPQSVVIRTPVGHVFHTADWKIDAQPVLGNPFNPTYFNKLADEGMLAMVCDSTNATDSGHSISEGACYDGLKMHIDAAEHRVVVACFGSNIARLLTLGKIALETNRRMALLGRSLQNMVSAAKATGLWPEEFPIIDPSHLAYLPREEVLAVATGSQGEPRTALTRLAARNHWDLDIEAEDTVIFSSKVIPGNELKVEQLIDRLNKMNIQTIESHQSDKPIHASGHPCAQELARLYELVKPSVAIPVHGEPQHIKANAGVAKSVGVPHQMTGNNGDIFQLSPHFLHRRNAVNTGRISLKR